MGGREDDEEHTFIVAMIDMVPSCCVYIRVEQFLYTNEICFIHAESVDQLIRRKHTLRVYDLALHQVSTIR